MDTIILQSPNKRISLAFKVQDYQGKSRCMTYQVCYDGKVLLDWSTLGFRLKEAADLEQNFEIINYDECRQDSSWKPVCGEKSEIFDRYEQMTIYLVENTQQARRLDLTFRAYDSGIAFAYTFLKHKNLVKAYIEEELTQFTFLQDHYVFATNTAQGSYKKVRISEMEPGTERPLLIEIEKGGPYVALAEAKLVDYARMKFESVGGNTIAGKLSGKPLYFFLEEEVLRNVPEENMVKVATNTPFTTPWRVIMIGETPGMLLEQNDIFLNLNDPCMIEDTSFIQPGKVIRDRTLTTEGGMACVDFAVKRNLQYIELDAGWYGSEYSFESDATHVDLDPQRYMAPLDLKKVIDYAKEKGIRIILYINQRAMMQQLDEILRTYKEWGVDGIKYGFVEVGTQRWTSWLHECVRKAADYGFVLTIHDEYRPTGYQRTYPNLLTQEGIRGDEERQPAENTLTTAFTRMLAGPGDNTVCYFNNRVGEYWSHAYQLAKSVVLFSPMMFLYWYDRPIGSFDTDPKKIDIAIKTRNYEAIEGIITDEPELEFFDHLVTTWDETRVIHGEVGDYITVARRSGDDWFVGTMNAKEKQEFNLPLSFLNPELSYTAHFYSDDKTLKTRTQVKTMRIEVKNVTVLTYVINAPGGVAIRIVPNKAGR